MKMILKLIYFALFVSACKTETLRYDNYAVYKVYPQNEVQLKALIELEYAITKGTTNRKFNFWNDPVPSLDYVNIMSSPEDKADLETFLSANGIKADMAIPNVQELIEKQTVKQYTRGNLRSMQWDAYYTLDDIYAWLVDLNSTYSDIVTHFNIGNSFEGRPINGIKISHGTGKRAIFIEGGIHAREWISPATVTYITDQLLTSNDPETVAAAQNYDWYIFPVTNPDGYVWTHISDRMWRKNRRPVGTEYGIDLNRNWDNNWNGNGSSTNPADQTYKGTAPFSEPETANLAAFIRSVGGDIDIYLSFHSYSQMLLLPYGNTTEPLANYDEAMNVGKRAMGALSVKYGTEYVTGNAAETIYIATGISIDWVKEEINVPLVYCYELRDRGLYGFILPPEQILPNNEEVMDSLLDIIHQGQRFGVISSAYGFKASRFLVLVLAAIFSLS